MRYEPIRAKAFLTEDKTMQEYKKYGHSCEKIEVYKYLLDLVLKDEGTTPDAVEERYGQILGKCSQCGWVVCEGERFCAKCGERLLWDEVTK